VDHLSLKRDNHTVSGTQEMKVRKIITDHSLLDSRSRTNIL
jgi:hypothetical protein